MLQIWACFKKCRLGKCQKRSAFRGGLTETKEEAAVHVWPCNKTDCTCESSGGGRATASHAWILWNRSGWRHCFSRPFTPVMSDRSLTMVLHHQLKSCTAVQEMRKWKNSCVHKCLLISLRMLRCSCEPTRFATTLFVGWGQGSRWMGPQRMWFMSMVSMF